MVYRVFMLAFCFVLIGCRHAQDVAWLDKVKQAQAAAVEQDPLLLLDEVIVHNSSESLVAYTTDIIFIVLIDAQSGEILSAKQETN